MWGFDLVDDGRGERVAGYGAGLACGRMGLAYGAGD
jgi:hypothetical protein